MEIHLTFRHLTHMTELQPNMVRPCSFFLLVLQNFRAVRQFLPSIFWTAFFSGVQNVGPLLFSRLFTADLDAYLASGCEEWCEEQVRQLNLPRQPCADDFLHNRQSHFPPYYTALLNAARLHYQNGNIEPRFALLQHPTAGYAWAPAAAVVRDIEATYETAGMVEGGNAYAGGA
jgi:hypothetical protein